MKMESKADPVPPHVRKWPQGHVPHRVPSTWGWDYWSQFEGSQTQTRNNHLDLSDHLCLGDPVAGVIWYGSRQSMYLHTMWSGDAWTWFDPDARLIISISESKPYISSSSNDLVSDDELWSGSESMRDMSWTRCFLWDVCNVLAPSIVRVTISTSYRSLRHGKPVLCFRWKRGHHIHCLEVQRSLQILIWFHLHESGFSVVAYSDQNCQMIHPAIIVSDSNPSHMHGIHTLDITVWHLDLIPLVRCVIPWYIWWHRDVYVSE